MHGIALARHPRARRTLLAAALPAALAAAALPGIAEANSVDLSGGNLSHVASTGVTNGVRVVDAGATVRIIDSNGLDQITGCARISTSEASCARAGVRTFVVQLGDGNDTFTAQSSLPVTVLAQDGNDTYLGGTTPTPTAVQFIGGSGGRSSSDRAFYGASTTGVTVTKDDQANDGRVGDRDNVFNDVDIVEGSNFADTITGRDTQALERFDGLAGNDTISGLGGPDHVLEGSAVNGADTVFGGEGEDRVNYQERTRRVEVQLDALRNDGEAGEQDFVSGDVEQLIGGRGDDFLVANGARNLVSGGNAGNDHLDGGAGDDVLRDAGRGIDRFIGGANDDVIDADDGAADSEIDCGTGTDTADRDANEQRVVGCERGAVGVLRLTPQAVHAGAGEAARVRLSWRHPQGWRNLDRVVLRVLQDDATVGEVAVTPRGRRIADEGAVRVIRRASRVTTRGKVATARLALRVDRSLAGARLGLEVEAVDRDGRRQLETDAGTLRIAG